MTGATVQGRTRMMIHVLVVGVVALIGAAWLLGWFSRPRPWQDSTGWSSIPNELRPSPSAPLADEPVIRWLGHSGFIIRWHGTTLLLDPNRSARCTVSRRFMEIPPGLDRLGPVHAVISHAHFDHLNQDTLVAIPELTSVLIPAGSEVFLDRVGERVTRVPVVTGTVYHVGNLSVTPVRAAHNGNRFHPLQSSFDARGYMIRSPDGTTLYYAGDTSFDMDWKGLRDAFHPDIAILPIGAYSPRIPLKYHHMNPEEAVLAAGELGVRKVIPCHFGTFTLSFDRPHAALPRFAAAMAGKSFPWEMPRFFTTNDLQAFSGTSE